ncbi:MAG: hypothetical protein AAF654_05030 [Myxococcota bacterium]
MPQICTPAFEIEVPELFEKVLFGRCLLRAERMDRAEDERVFAELNLYFGPVEDAGAGVAEQRSLAEAVDACLDSHLKRQVDPGPLDVQTRDGGMFLGLLTLPGNGWRPACEQYLWLECLETQAGRCFVSFVLEYDARFAERYRAVARAMIDSFSWTDAPIDVGLLERQRDHLWSIFDDMPDARREAIVKRYRAILGRIPRAPEPTMTVAVEFDPQDLPGSAKRLLDRVPCTSRVSTPVFVVPLEVEIEEDLVPDRRLLIEILQQISAWTEHDRATAAEHVWEHCTLCLEVTDYGAPDGTSNDEYFGIHGPDDALRELGPGTLRFPDPDFGETANVFGVAFYPPWENEHGCTLVVSHGRFAGWVSAGERLEVPQRGP